MGGVFHNYSYICLPFDNNDTVTTACVASVLPTVLVYRMQRQYTKYRFHFIPGIQFSIRHMHKYQNHMGDA